MGGPGRGGFAGNAAPQGHMNGFGGMQQSNGFGGQQGGYGQQQQGAYNNWNGAQK